MKKLFLTAFFLSVGFNTLSAGYYSFKPSDADLGDLDHHNATTWGITWDGIPAGQSIVSATLTIKNIRDWKVENNDALFIHLLDNPKKTTSGLKVVVDDPNDNVRSDYFKGQGTYLDTWTDTRTTMDEYLKNSKGQYVKDSNGNRISTNTDYIYHFTEDDLEALTQYITNANAPVMKQVYVPRTKVNGKWVAAHYDTVVDYYQDDFGFGFDPDCHYYNDGVSFVIRTAAASVPEGGSTLALMGAALIAALGVRRRFQRAGATTTR